uniref:Ig-like domain-containing protein n=1 Tax=Leptobrachium leishanense TaxID=445787 RepID=A0A8C5PZW6_9ANUR
TWVPPWHIPGATLTSVSVFPAGGTLEMYGPSTQQARMGSDALIPCTFTVDKPPVDPKYFAVFWYFKGNEILSYNDVVETKDPRFSLNTDSSLNGDASLSVSRVMMSDKGVYKCSIIYSPERKEKEVTLYGLMVRLHATLFIIFIVFPSFNGILGVIMEVRIERVNSSLNSILYLLQF